MIIEPPSTLGSGDRVEVKRDSRVHDVVVVDVGQRLEVVERRRSNRMIHNEMRVLLYGCTDRPLPLLRRESDNDQRTG